MQQQKYLEEDAIPYKKRSNKKSPKKADHKHEYEDVIFLYWNKHKSFSRETGFVCGESTITGSRCKICGSLNYASSVQGSYTSTVDYREVYPDLPVVEVSDIWHLNKS